MTRQRHVVNYALLVGLPLLGLLGVLQLGGDLVSAGLEAPAAAAARSPGLRLPLLLGQVLVVLATARLAGRLMAYFGQPRVVGEMAAGILLGPSLLGWALPGVAAALFPPASLGFVNALSQIGLLLFMFLVGLEIDPAHLRERSSTAVVTSHASILAPFLMGATLSLLLYPRLAPAGVTFTGFALFVGAAMSVTAFPVLARILSERKLTRTRLGTTAIACAAVDDVTAWCILAVVVVIVRADQAEVPLWLTLGGTVLYVAVMLTVVRAGLRKLADRARRSGALSQDTIAMIILTVFASAWVTERLGIHALFGAFLVGAIMPKDRELVAGLLGRFEDVMVVLLVPLFFAFTGLRTRVGLIHGAGPWLLCLLIIAVAVAGKLGGTAVAARATGLPWRESFALGALMNTRGLMELVILNIGLEIGVISPVLFAMMVLMAFATTLMTTPLLAWLWPASRHGEADPAVR